MELYVQWIVVGVIVVSAVVWAIRRRRRSDGDCGSGCSGCSGCSLKDNCKSRRE